MHSNQSYIISSIQTQKHVPNPCTAFIDEEDYYHNSLVYSGSSTLYKVRFMNYKNNILVVGFMQICLSNNIYTYTQYHTGIFEAFNASCTILFYSLFPLSPICTLRLIFSLHLCCSCSCSRTYFFCIIRWDDFNCMVSSKAKVDYKTNFQQ
jgi:hypothetical protein